jgi:hypothetical protein
MSDQQSGKKMVEAYEWVTKEKLTKVGSNESPDFICSRPNGEKIGLEISEVMRDPRDATYEEIIKYKYEQDPWDAMQEIYRLIEKKDRQRASNYGRWSDQTILVLKLSECSLSDLLYHLDGLEEDYAEFGFLEIWLADFTGQEAYGDIELFGLSPARWWGYHQRPDPYRKPYG